MLTVCISLLAWSWWPPGDQHSGNIARQSLGHSRGPAGGGWRPLGHGPQHRRPRRQWVRGVRHDGARQGELVKQNISDQIWHLSNLNLNKVSRRQVSHSGRALNHGKCALEFSVMMVAFDLEEVASQGSLAFIQDFLIPTVLKQTGTQIQGELQQC